MNIPTLENKTFNTSGCNVKKKKNPVFKICRFLFNSLSFLVFFKHVKYVLIGTVLV